MKELFQRIDMFEGLDNKVLSQMADAAIMRHFGKEETIVEEGQTGLGMYIVISGRVRVVRKHSTGERLLAVLGPEQVFAEMALLEDKPRSASVVTSEETECILLTRDSFVKLMNKYPEIPVRVARVLAERLRAANEKLDNPQLAASPPGAPAPPPPSSESAAASSAASNGSGDKAASASGTSKAKIQESLLSFFENLYTMKAFTRFSVAILGCPVEARGDAIVERTQVGDVKVIVVPAGRPASLRIEAREAGHFTLHLLTPEFPSPRRWGPEPIAPSDEVALHLVPGRAALRRGSGASKLEPRLTHDHQHWEVMDPYGCKEGVRGTGV